MAEPQLVGRRASTPVRSPESSGPGQSLPSDVMLQTCHRVWAMSLVATGLWTFAIVMNNVVFRVLGHPAMMAELWPFPGNLVSAIGLAASLLMVYLSGKFGHRPELLLDLSSVFLVVICMLTSILTQWVPPPESPRISWLCVEILAYAAIVPGTPKRTFLVAFIAASTEPLALWITDLRGVLFDHSALYYIWDFVPTYLCAVIAVVPARIIRGLGQQVRRARELGSYRLEGLLGQGGMGEVYRASHQMLARPAAIKLIRAEVLGASSAAQARVMVQRFKREAESAASLRSPHTIDLYDFGVSQDGTFFFVMELLDGMDLDTLVRRYGPVSPARAAHLLRQACHSLEEAHVRGLIHRDVKPSNIFTCRLGLEVDFVKVLDFGLVKAAMEEDPDAARLTAPDRAAGTPSYMAPEMVLGNQAVDHRVDLYALGCVAYWLVTGQQVFDAPGTIQLLFKHAQEAPVPPSQRTELEIPPAFDAVVLECLAKRPEDRPQTAGELARRLALAVDAQSEWSDEQAMRWWQRHHPASTRIEPTRGDGPTLTKTMLPDSAPAQSAAQGAHA